MSEPADVPHAVAPGADSIEARARTAGAKIGPLRIGAFREAPAHVEAIDRVREWTRERFELAQDAAVLVSELACSRPGCPPLETFVAFWSENQRRYHFKIFKSVDEVVSGDLPPAWLKDALCAIEEMDFACC